MFDNSNEDINEKNSSHYQTASSSSSDTIKLDNQSHLELIDSIIENENDNCLRRNNVRKQQRSRIIQHKNNLDNEITKKGKTSINSSSLSSMPFKPSSPVRKRMTNSQFVNDTYYYEDLNHKIDSNFQDEFDEDETTINEDIEDTSDENYSDVEGINKKKLSNRKLNQINIKQNNNSKSTNLNSSTTNQLINDLINNPNNSKLILNNSPSSNQYINLNELNQYSLNIAKNLNIVKQQQQQQNSKPTRKYNTKLNNRLKNQLIDDQSIEMHIKSDLVEPNIISVNRINGNGNNAQSPETYLIDRYKYAVRHIRQGLSVEEACNKYRISKGALLKCLSGGTAPRGKKTRLSESEENEIVEWLINNKNLKYNEAIHLVFEQVVKIFQQAQRPNPFNNGKPSMDWWYDFLSRHPQIMASKPEWLRRGKVNDQYIKDVQSGKLRCTKFRRALLSAIQYIRSVSDAAMVAAEAATCSNTNTQNNHIYNQLFTTSTASSNKSYSNLSKTKTKKDNININNKRLRVIEKNNQDDNTNSTLIKQFKNFRTQNINNKKQTIINQDHKKSLPRSTNASRQRNNEIINIINENTNNKINNNNSISIQENDEDLDRLVACLVGDGNIDNQVSAESIVECDNVIDDITNSHQLTQSNSFSIDLNNNNNKQMNISNKSKKHIEENILIKNNSEILNDYVIDSMLTDNNKKLISTKSIPKVIVKENLLINQGQDDFEDDIVAPKCIDNFPLLNSSSTIIKKHTNSQLPQSHLLIQDDEDVDEETCQFDHNNNYFINNQAMIGIENYQEDEEKDMDDDDDDEDDDDEDDEDNDEDEDEDEDEDDGQTHITTLHEFI
jgi:hypothetical protein